MVEGFLVEGFIVEGVLMEGFMVEGFLVEGFLVEDFLVGFTSVCWVGWWPASRQCHMRLCGANGGDDGPEVNEFQCDFFGDCGEDSSWSIYLSIFFVSIERCLSKLVVTQNGSNIEKVLLAGG